MGFWLKNRQRDALPSRLGRARVQRRRSQQRASLNTRPKARPGPATSTGKTANRVTWQDQIGESESSARATESATEPAATGNAAAIPPWFHTLPLDHESDRAIWAAKLAAQTGKGVPAYDDALARKIQAVAYLTRWEACVKEKELAVINTNGAKDRAADARANAVVAAAAAEKGRESLAELKQVNAGAERDFIAFLDTIHGEPSFGDKKHTEMLRNRCTVAASDLASAKSGLQEVHSDHRAAQQAVNDTKAEAITAAQVLDAAVQMAADAARAATEAAAAAGITDTSGASLVEVAAAIIQAKAAVDQHIDAVLGDTSRL